METDIGALRRSSTCSHASLKCSQNNLRVAPTSKQPPVGLPACLSHQQPPVGLWVTRRPQTQAGPLGTSLHVLDEVNSEAVLIEHSCFALPVVEDFHVVDRIGEPR